MSEPDRTNGRVIVCAPIVGSTTHDRAIVELDAGTWQVGKLDRSDRTKFEREFSFSIDDLLTAAMYGFEGNPGISTMFGKAPGKGLSAGILLFAVSMKLVDVTPVAPAKVGDRV